MFLILKSLNWKEEDYIKSNIIPFGWYEDNNRAYPNERIFNFKCLRHLAKTVPQSITKQACKRTGEAHDMIRTLGQYYTFAAIARVFGYSKENIRLICKED